MMCRNAMSQGAVVVVGVKAVISSETFYQERPDPDRERRHEGFLNDRELLNGSVIERVKLALDQRRHRNRKHGRHGKPGCVT
jgi:hypothetical protein